MHMPERKKEGELGRLARALFLDDAPEISARRSLFSLSVLGFLTPAAGLANRQRGRRNVGPWTICDRLLYY